MSGRPFYISQYMCRITNITPTTFIRLAQSLHLGKKYTKSSILCTHHFQLYHHQMWYFDLCLLTSLRHTLFNLIIDSCHRLFHEVISYITMARCLLHMFLNTVLTVEGFSANTHSISPIPSLHSCEYIDALLFFVHDPQGIIGARDEQAHISCLQFTT